MSFHLSPASLLDQYGSEAFSFLTPSGMAWLNATLDTPPQELMPQLFVVNPASDNIFRHINPQTAHAAIVNLIYTSMWMGALGWDIVSTMSFDVRLLRETKWSSAFPAIYSIAYFLSRYVSLAWLVTVVTNSVIMTDSCNAWMKGSTTLFSVAISSTTLVFCLRTCSLWHLQQRIVFLVVTSWVLVVAFSVLLPIMSYGNELLTSSFCAWHFNGLYVVGVFSAVLLFDLLCLVLTVCKLNKAGWRGMLRGLFPTSQHNFDSEDVKTMLVQRTTAFFVIQFIFLVTALLVYVLTQIYAYRMMNLLASVAVASSMAGRIFRRAWRQTRELAPHNINRPPSYYPAWAKAHRGCEQHTRPQTANSDISPLPADPCTTHQLSNGKDDDSTFFYVEGEFRPKPKVTSAGTGESTHVLSAAQAYASQQLSAMEVGQGHLTADDPSAGNDDLVMISRQDTAHPVSGRPLTAGALDKVQSPAPAYSRRERSLSRPTTRDLDFINRAESSEETGLTARTSTSPGQARQNGPTDSQALFNNGSSIAFSSLTGSVRNSQSSRDLAATSESLGYAWTRRSSAVGGVRSQRWNDQGAESDPPTVDEKRRRYITSPPISAGAKINSKEESRKVYDVESVKAAARLEGYPHYHLSNTRPLTASSATRRCAETDGMYHRPSSGNRSPGESSLSAQAGKNLEADTRRPKTAPSTWSTQTSGNVLKETCPPHLSQANLDDDALVAFLQTVDQDSRTWVNDANFAGADEGRPRTSRGTTATSVDDDAAVDSDSTIPAPSSPLSSVLLGSNAKRKSRRASRPDLARPSTAVGIDDPKPFGFGTLSSRAEPDLTDSQAVHQEDDELGSVIQQQYILLAAQAGMPLEPPS